MPNPIAVPTPTLNALRQWCEQADPVFICGLERSGTSALQLTLARHPALFNIRNVFETFIFVKPQGPYHAPVAPMTASYLRGKPNVQALQRLAADLAAAHGAPLGDADLIRLFFWFAAQQIYPGRRPLEKTPSHVRQLARLFDVFPRARVLVCTREPVEIIASYRKRLAREQSLGKPREHWGWLDKTPQVLIQHFRKVTQQLHEARATHGKQLFTVPYQWLTADAETALRAICTFAALEFDAALLSREDQAERPVDPLLSSPLKPNEADVGAFLDGASVRSIEEQTAELAAEWRTAGVSG